MIQTPIYKDHTGQWREENPFAKCGEHMPVPCCANCSCDDFYKFEQSITYHPFPNEPNVKQGEVVMARLQWQEYNGMSHTWQNTDNLESHAPKRQIWVAANQEIKNARECGVPETVHGTSCGWVNACYTIDAETDEEKRWNREWVKAHPQIHLSGESTFNQEGEEEQAKEPVVDNLTAKLINAAKYGYEFHRTTQFPDLSFNEGCRNNFLQYLQTFESPSAPKIESAFSEDELMQLLSDERERAVKICMSFYDKYTESYNSRIGAEKHVYGDKPHQSTAFVDKERADVARICANSISGKTGLKAEEPIIEVVKREYATLKTSSLQQENDKLWEEILRLNMKLNNKPSMP